MIVYIGVQIIYVKFEKNYILVFPSFSILLLLGLAVAFFSVIPLALSPLAFASTHSLYHCTEIPSIWL